MALIAEDVMPSPQPAAAIKSTCGRVFFLLLIKSEDNLMAKAHDDFLKKMKD